MQLAQMVLQIAEKELQSDAVKKGIVTIAEKAILQIDTEKLAVIIEKELKTICIQLTQVTYYKFSWIN